MLCTSNDIITTFIHTVVARAFLRSQHRIHIQLYVHVHVCVTGWDAASYTSEPPLVKRAAALNGRLLSGVGFKWLSNATQLAYSE